jgi:transposase
MQMAMVTACPDDLVPTGHSVRMVMAVVETLDLSRFHESIKARLGVAGRDATDPKLLVALWLYACIRAIGSARELARRCVESAPFQWLCGGVSVNYHMLADFRTEHGAALDDLFTQVIASLVDKDVVAVSRVSQDGVRVRVSAGAGGFRSAERLEQLLTAAREHVEQVRQQVDSPALAAVTARQQAARKRAAREREQRLQQAIEQLPELQQRQAERNKKVGQGPAGKKVRERQPRVSTTDAEARRMKMPNGGFNPAVNVQLATDTESRAIVGVEVTNEGSDNAGLSEPMRAQVEQRTGGNVEQHLLDGGYMRKDDLERAQSAGVELFIPPKNSAGGHATRTRTGAPAWRCCRCAGMETAHGGRRRQRGLPSASSDQRNRQRRSEKLSRTHADHGARSEEGAMRGAVVRAGLQSAALRRQDAGIDVANEEKEPLSCLAKPNQSWSGGCGDRKRDAHQSMRVHLCLLAAKK